MPWFHGDVVRIVVPGVPRAWQRSGHKAGIKDGKAFTQSFTKAPTRDAQAEFKDFAERAMNGRAPIDQEIEFRVAFYMPVPRSWSKRKQADALADRGRPITKPDFDNMTKMIDALNGVVWRDDSLITDAGISKRYSDRPRLVVEVRPLVFRAGLME